MKFFISKQCYAVLGYLLILLILIWPSRFAAKYDFIKHEDILSEVVEKVTKNQSHAGGVKCDYRDVIEENLWLFTEPFKDQVLNNYNILMGQFI